MQLACPNDWEWMAKTVPQQQSCESAEEGGTTRVANEATYSLIVDGVAATMAPREEPPWEEQTKPISVFPPLLCVSYCLLTNQKSSKKLKFEMTLEQKLCRREFSIAAL